MQIFGKCHRCRQDVIGLNVVDLPPILYVGTALSSSPLGLAAYILEKFSTWTHKNNPDAVDGNLTKRFTLDELLTNIMIYWIDNSITSSQRFYKENFSFKERDQQLER